MSGINCQLSVCIVEEHNIQVSRKGKRFVVPIIGLHVDFR